MVKFLTIFAYLFVCGLITAQTIQKKEQLSNSKRCYIGKSVLVNRYAVGGIKKLISCLKSKALENTQTRTSFAAYFKLNFFKFKFIFNFIENLKKNEAKSNFIYSRWGRFGK